MRKRPFAVADAGPDEAGLDVLRGDGRARQRRALRVGDGADDGRGFLLGGGCGRMQPQHCGKAAMKSVSHVSSWGPERAERCAGV